MKSIVLAAASSLLLSLSSAHFTYMSCPSDGDCDAYNEKCCQCSNPDKPTETAFLCVHTNVTKLPSTTTGNPYLNVRYLGWDANCKITIPGGPFGKPANPRNGGMKL